MSQVNDPTAGRELFSREMSVTINASPETIFPSIADIRRHPEWAANPLEIRHIAGPANGEEATFASVARRTARVAGTFTGQIRVLASEPPHLLRYEVRDTSGHYHWTITLAPEGSSTRLTQRMAKLSGPWIINVLQPGLIWPLIGAHQVRVGLERLKACAETGR